MEKMAELKEEIETMMAEYRKVVEPINKQISEYFVEINRCLDSEELTEDEAKSLVNRILEVMQGGIQEEIGDFRDVAETFDQLDQALKEIGDPFEDVEV